MRPRVRIGIIGGGLMGREMASTFGRWFALTNVDLDAKLVAVCDTSAAALEWFERVPTVTHRVSDYRELLALPDVDVVYVAVPHNLHEQIYLDVLSAKKDMLAEKPFGIDLAAAERIQQAVIDSGCFVRCSSEMPFFPGAQAVYHVAKSEKIGRLLEVRSCFWHSSDLDPNKQANWKRQSATCGEIGVMGDLGMHVAHIPLRLGMMPTTVYAQLQKGYPERPDGNGGMAKCDTWDNALLHCGFGRPGEAISEINNQQSRRSRLREMSEANRETIQNSESVLRLEMKRMAPGETNTWSIEVLGTEGGARFSTKEPKTLWQFAGGKQQKWERIDLGFQTPFPTVTGGIFEPGFPDCIQQMWAAFLTERAGVLGDRFGCVTVEEAVQSHELFHAALQSHKSGRAATV